MSDKANTDLQNVDDNLTISEQQGVREKLAAASQTDLTLAGNAITANAAAAAAASAAAAVASEQAVAAADSPVRSNTLPANVGPMASAGTGDAVLRADAVHALPTDDTLEFDPVSGDLKVAIHKVIEHSQERITYHTDADAYIHGGGATVGQIYTTSAFQKTITTVEVDFDPETGGATEYEVRLDRVHENRDIEEKIGVSQSIMVMGAPGRRTFNFTHDNGEIGIPIDPSIRLGVLCSRIGDGHDAGAFLRHGPEAAGSPNESYDDGSADFNLVGGVVYRVENPGIGQSSHSHQDDQTVGGQIWGNIRITYRITYDHGTLVGATKADRDLQNIADDLTDAEKQAVRDRIDAAEETDASGAAVRVAGVLDITDNEDWVEARNYADTTDLVGVDRTARYMSYLDGNLYFADASGAVNTRDFGSAITGMARGDGLFVTSEGGNLVVRGATDLTQLNSASYGARHAIAVQQDDHSKFWSLALLSNGNVSVREVSVSDAGVLSVETVRHTITVSAINTALGDRYFDATSIYVPASGDGVVDLHVVSASEFWIIFAGLPLADDLTTEFTVMVKAEIVPGSSTFQLVADSVEEFARDDGRSFVRIGDGLVYLSHSDGGGGVARYEKKSARAEVYREHQQDRIHRVTPAERDAGTEDGVRDYSPADIASMAGNGVGEAVALAGQTVETLFDNRADTEAAITVNAGVRVAQSYLPMLASEQGVSRGG